MTWSIGMVDLPGNLRSPQALSAKKLEPMLSNGAWLSPGTFWQIQQEISRTCFVLETKDGLAFLNLTLKDDAPMNRINQHRSSNWVEKTITMKVSQNTQTIIDPAQTAHEIAKNGTYGCPDAELCPNNNFEKKLLLTEISWQGDGLFKTSALEIFQAGDLPVLNTDLGSSQNSSIELNSVGHYQILQSNLQRRTSPQPSAADLESQPKQFPVSFDLSQTTDQELDRSAISWQLTNSVIQLDDRAGLRDGNPYYVNITVDKGMDLVGNASCVLKSIDREYRTECKQASDHVLRCDLPSGAAPGVYAVSLISHTGRKLPDNTDGRHVVVTASKLQLGTASVRQAHNGMQEVRVVVHGIDERREVVNGLDWLALSGSCHAATDAHSSGPAGSTSTHELNDRALCRSVGSLLVCELSCDQQLVLEHAFDIDIALIDGADNDIRLLNATIQGVYGYPEAINLGRGINNYSFTPCSFSLVDCDRVTDDGWMVRPLAFPSGSQEEFTEVPRPIEVLASQSNRSGSTLQEDFLASSSIVLGQHSRTNFQITKLRAETCNATRQLLTNSTPVSDADCFTVSLFSKEAHRYTQASHIVMFDDMQYQINNQQMRELEALKPENLPKGLELEQNTTVSETNFTQSVLQLEKPSGISVFLSIADVGQLQAQVNGTHHNLEATALALSGRWPEACSLIGSSFMRCAALNETEYARLRLSLDIPDSAITILGLDAAARTVDVGYFTPYLVPGVSQALEFELNTSSSLLIETLANQTFHCALRGADGSWVLGAALARRGERYRCLFQSMTEELGPRVSLFLTLDGIQLITVAGAILPTIPPPVLNSIEPRDFLTGHTQVRLQGTDLGLLASIELAAGQSSMQVTSGFTVAAELDLVTFELPVELLSGKPPKRIAVSVTNEYGQTSNQLAVALGFGINFETEGQAVGFTNQTMSFLFHSDLALDDLKAPECIVSSFSNNNSRTVATARATGEFGCTFECIIETSMLEPGNQRLQLSIDGEPALHDLGNATLVSSKSHELKLLNQTVVADALQTEIIIKSPPELNIQMPLWCVYSTPSSSMRSKIEAIVTNDSIRCSTFPSTPAQYDLSLTFDGLNSLEVGDQLNVVTPNHLSISSVFPPLIPLIEEPFRSSPWSFHVYGYGLDGLRPEQVQLFLDGVSAKPVWTRIEKDVLSIRAPYHPAQDLELQLLSEKLTQLVEPIRVRVVPRPVVESQVLKIYDGEAAIIRGAGFFDQLNLWCNSESTKTPAEIINATALSCPHAAFISPPGSPGRGRRELLVGSESLGISLTPGTPSGVSVELFEVPFVTAQTSLSKSLERPDELSLLLTMSGLVLDREISIGSPGGPRHRCEKRSSYEIECLFSSRIFDPSASLVDVGSLVLWPGGPHLSTPHKAQVPSQARILKLQPSSLVAGQPGQSVRALGKNLGTTIPTPFIVPRIANISDGSIANVAILSDNEARVSDLPSLGSRPGSPRKVSVSLHTLDGTIPDRRELFVVDQIRIRGLSPTFAVTSSHEQEIFVSVADQLYDPLGYSCFLTSSMSQLLERTNAVLLGSHLLKCIFKMPGGPQKYQVGITINEEVPPASYKHFFVLRKPQLQRFRNEGMYYLTDMATELEVWGLWDWYPELPEPLIIIRDKNSGELLHVVSGSYRTSKLSPLSVQSSIMFRLPPTSHHRLSIEVSQTGELVAFDATAALELQLVDKPTFKGISPSFIDSLQTASQTLSIAGEHFVKDGGLPSTIDNLLCMINNGVVAITHFNDTFVLCTLVPSLGTQKYTVSISVNYGQQWVQASELAVTVVDLPQIAGVTPMRISANMISRVKVLLTRQAIAEALELSIEHFDVLAQQALGFGAYSLTVKPKVIPKPTYSHAKLRISAPGIAVDSAFSELQIPGAISVLGTSPIVVLGFREWVELKVLGSHLDLQVLFCRVNGKLFELQVIASGEGLCLISVTGIHGLVGVEVVSEHGEKVPGGGQLTVIQGTAEQLWPQLASAVSFQGTTLQVNGSGFRSGESKCILKNSTHSFKVLATVMSPQLLDCQLDQGLALPFLAPVLSVQVVNELADDLLGMLQSQVLSLETEQSVWTQNGTQLIKQTSTSGMEKEETIGLSSIQRASLLLALDEQVPQALLEGGGQGLDINLALLAAKSGTNTSGCVLTRRRLGTATSLVSGCSIQPSQIRWSTVFESENTISIAVVANGATVALPRLIPIVRKLKVAYLSPQITSKSKLQALEVYLSPGLGAAEWQFLPPYKPAFVFTCSYGSILTQPVAGQQSSWVSSASILSDQPPGHYRVSCPLDWTLPGLYINITYTAAGQSVNQDISSFIRGNQSFPARRTTATRVELGPFPAGSLAIEIGQLYCRFQGDHGAFQYSILTLVGHLGHCTFPSQNWVKQGEDSTPWVTVVQLPNEHLSVEIPVSWPSQVVDVDEPQIAISPTKITSPTSEVITALNPSLIFVDDCKRLVGASQESVLITGVNFGPQTRFFFGVYLNKTKVELSVQSLDCGLVHQSLARCAMLSQFACSSFEQNQLRGRRSISFLIAATNGNHTVAQLEGTLPLQLSKAKDSQLFQVSASSNTMRCSMHQEEGGIHQFRFNSSEQVLLELRNSRRDAACLYRAFGKEYAAQAEESVGADGSHQFVCPQQANQRVSFVSPIVEEVSLVVPDISGIGHTNLTSTPCRPSSQLSIQAASVLAWLEPPVLVCNSVREHLLHIQDTSSTDIQSSMDEVDLKVLEALPQSVGKNHTSYRVSMQIQCYEHTPNSTQKWLTIGSGQNPNSTKLHVLVIKPFTILSVRAQKWEDIARQSQLASLVVVVDRPWDLGVLAEAAGASLVCTFIDTESGATSLMNFDAKAFACSVPRGPSTLVLQLGLHHTNGTNILTLRGYSISRTEEISQSSTSSGLVDPLALIQNYSLSSPHELVYGQVSTPEINFQLNNTFGGEPSGTRCLVKSTVLPLMVFAADLTQSTTSLDGQWSGLVQCTLGDQRFLRLETAGVKEVEVGLTGPGPGLTLTDERWFVIALQARVRIVQASPSELILRPGSSHTVTLYGEFQTLASIGMQREGSLPIWVRLKSSSATKVFKVEELRPDRVRFKIPGAALAAGIETSLEIGDTPGPVVGLRTLAVSSFNLTTKAYLPIIDSQPKVALSQYVTAAPTMTNVSLLLLHPPESGRSLACAERRLASAETFIWSTARALSAGRYECSVQDGRTGVHEFGLGYQLSTLEEVQLLTDLVQLVLLPLEVTGLSPAAGPTAGGTKVRLHGAGFLSLADYGGGLLCQFGTSSSSVTATPVTDKLLECPAPPTSRATSVVVELHSQNPQEHLVKLMQTAESKELRTYTYHSWPTIVSVHPAVLSLSAAALNLTVFLSESAPPLGELSILCQLQSQVSSNQKLSKAIVVGELVSAGSIFCSIPAPTWLSSAQSCSLALSFNGGADFSSPSDEIKVILPSRILSVLQLPADKYANTAGIALNVTGLDEVSAGLTCRVQPPNKSLEPWFLPAIATNSTYAECLDGAGVLQAAEAREATVELDDPLLGLTSSPVAAMPASTVTSVALPATQVNFTGLLNQNVSVATDSEASVQSEGASVSNDNFGTAIVKEPSGLLVLIASMPSLSFTPFQLSLNGWGFGSGRHHNLELTSDDRNFTLEAQVTSSSDQLLVLDLASQPTLLQALQEDQGGLFKLAVTNSIGANLPVIVLNRPLISKVTSATTPSASPTSGLGPARQFLEITAENLPLGGPIKILCVFKARAPGQGPARFTEFFMEARITSNSTITKKPWRSSCVLECELPAEMTTSSSSGQAGNIDQKTMAGRLVFEVAGKKGDLSQQDATALDFVFDLAMQWSVLRSELRDQDIWVYGTNFPTEPGRLACIIDSGSSKRFSSAVVQNITLLRCSAQSFSGSLAITVRDLATGASSQSVTLSRAAEPKILLVVPVELYLPPAGQVLPLPVLQVTGERFSSDCFCMLDSWEYLNTTLTSASQLSCSLTSSRALSAAEKQTEGLRPWSLTISCPNRGWVSSAVALWPRRGPQLLSVRVAWITQTSYLDGAAMIELRGLRLTTGLTCVQQSLANATRVFTSTLTTKNAQGTEAVCEVFKDLFDEAPVNGLEVKLSIQGDHVVDSSVTLVLFPRAILSPVSGSALLYKETPDQEVVLNSSHPVGDLLAPRIRCLFRPTAQSAHIGPAALNISYSTTPTSVNRQLIHCPLPTVWDGTLDHLWLTLQLERAADGLPIDLTSPYRLWLKPAPRIMYISPAVLPAGPPTSDHHVRLVEMLGVDASLHAVVVGDSARQTPLQLGSDGVVFFVAPVTAAGFERLSVQVLESWKSNTRQGNATLSWPSRVGLEYLDLPQTHSALPDSLRAGPLLPGAQHMVVVAGQNFTSATRCVVGGAAAPTRWLASNLIECQVTQQGVAGSHVVIQLLERGLYLSRGSGVVVQFTTKSSVYKVEPKQVLIGRFATLTKVFIADPENQSAPRPSAAGYFCKFGSKAIRAQSVHAIVNLGPTSTPTTSQEVHCRSPLASGPQTVTVEVITPSGSTYSAGISGASFEYVARPSFKSITPATAPLLPSGAGLALQLSGTGFSASFEYTCNFTRPENSQFWVTAAQRLSDQALSCPLPTIDPLLTRLSLLGPFFLDMRLRAQWLTPALALTTPADNSAILGKGRILLYTPPSISSIWPPLGSTAGGAPLYVTGTGFQLGLAQSIKCRFAGALVVSARVIERSTLLKCESPPHPISTATAVTVEVSVDDSVFFGGHVGGVTFIYNPPPVFDVATPNISPSHVGIDKPQLLTISGSGFPAASMLASGHPLCRFTFSTTSYQRLSVGTVVDAANIKCPTPIGSPDSKVDLAISFNGVEFHEVLTSTQLVYDQRPAVMAIAPAFAFPDAALDLTVSGTRLDQVATVGHGGLGLYPSQLELPVTAVGSAGSLIVPGAQYLNVSTLGDQKLFGNPASIVEVARLHSIGFSQDRVIEQYVDRPRLLYSVPAVVRTDGIAPIVLRGRSFKRTTTLACKFGALWGTSARFINETAIECLPPPLAVGLGTITKLAVSLNGQGLSDLTTISQLALNLLVADTPLPVGLDPTLVAVGETDIKVVVQATGLANVTAQAGAQIFCKISTVGVPAGVALPAAYIEDTIAGTQSAICMIPSGQFLQGAAGLGTASPRTMAIELSNDGIVFSTAGLEVFALQAAQVYGIEPANGPETGGTVIDVNLAALPVMNAVTPTASCIFPGGVEVAAVFVSIKLIRCTSPPLNLQAPEVVPASALPQRDFLFWAPVIVMHEGRRIGAFVFAYANGAKVLHLEPPDVVAPAAALTAADPAAPVPLPFDLPLQVDGVAFLPARVAGLRCRLEEGPNAYVVVVAEYLRNGTLSCLVPGATLKHAWAARAALATTATLGVEVSLNGGQQYTASGKGVILREADVIITSGVGAPALDPGYGYVDGGTLVTLRYSKAHSPASPRARCLFRRVDPSDGSGHLHWMPIFVLDESASVVQCFTPPANLINAELANGGEVAVFLSTNGRDPSSNSEPFLYRQTPKISSVDPVWLLAATGRTVSVTGQAFFSPTPASTTRRCSTATLLCARLTALSDSTRQRIVALSFATPTLVEFAWPPGAFVAGEQLRLEISLDGGLRHHKAPQALTVYGELVLARVRPPVVYQWQAGTPAQILYAETLTDLADTEGLGRLRCRFARPAAATQPTDAHIATCPGCDAGSCVCTVGAFLNTTLARCPMPHLEPGEVEVSLSVDGGASYSAPSAAGPAAVVVLPPSDGIVVNTTSLFETSDERVFVELQDASWGPNVLLFARVGGATLPAPVGRGTTPTATIELPRSLAPGAYTVVVSADGGTVFQATSALSSAPAVTPTPPSASTSSARRLLSSHSTTPPAAAAVGQLAIQACPAGSVCSPGLAQSCPKGHYCPQSGQLAPVECPVGWFTDVAGALKCKPCAPGTHCPSPGMPEARVCPPGFSCSTEATGSLNQLEPCPAGFFCGTGTDPVRCPDGTWCPQGTATLLPSAGNFSSPQPCRDGVRCEAPSAGSLELLVDPGMDTRGARGPRGVLDCPVGHVCAVGRSKPCPAGAYCATSGLTATRPCPPGSFQPTPGASGCQLCPPGTFCFYSGQSTPYQCKPGFTCQYEGSATPTQPCPAGSYCPRAIAANFAGSTMQRGRQPRLCGLSTYCLWGVYTPEVDAENAQAAQVCIAGTYCGEGSETPDGKGKCREGYFCPPNVSEMIEAPAGSYAEGTGNVTPELCRRGTYQARSRAAKCDPCLRGHECPDQGMVKPQQCGKGTFSKKVGETQCTACPQGTYSDELGLTAEESCLPCEAKYLCKKSGLTTMYEAELCQEGYLCGTRTTRTVMLTQPCPAGYFTAPGASSKEDAFLCPASRYCSRGTSASKVGQNECLPGYFCPLGTAASLSLDGTFGPGVHMVDRQELIGLIRALLKRNEEWLQRNPLEPMLERQRTQTTQLRRETERTDGARDEAVIERRETEITATRWAIDRWNATTQHTQARARYLKEIDIAVECQANQGLPAELVEKYFQGGQNLRCPSGTSSGRGSSCLGDCRKSRSSSKPISILDPLDRRDLGGEGRGVAQPAQSSSTPAEATGLDGKRALADEEDAWAARWDTPLPIHVLQPLETALVRLDFRDVPRGFEYNEHYAIVVLGRDAAEAKAKDGDGGAAGGREQEAWRLEHEQGLKQQTLPHYFAAANDEATSETGGTVKRAVLELKLFNPRKGAIEFSIGVYLYHGLFRPYLDYLANKVSIEFYHANRQRMGTPKTWAVLISAQQMVGVTMPYNVPDLGNEPLFYIDMSSTAEGVNPGTKGLEKDIFDGTFWQSKQVSAVIMPWIPFFSNCEGYDSHMVLYDVFERGGRCDLPAYESIRVVNPVPTDGLEPIADKCAPTAEYPEMKCRFDEPLNEPASGSTRWYALAEERDLFYVTRDPIDIEQFKAVSDESDNAETAYVRAIEDGSDELVPATFHPELGRRSEDKDGHPIVPTLVEVDFLYYQKTRDIKLMAQVGVYLREYKAMRPQSTADTTSSAPDPVYRLRLTYRALSYWSLINSFQFGIPIYILLFTFVSIVLVLCVVVFWLINLQFSTFRRPPALRFSHLARVTFVPPATGAAIATVPVLIVAGFLRLLQAQEGLFTTLAASWSDFGNEISISARIQAGRGRLGLAFVLLGILFLLHGSNTIISKPSEAEQDDILEERKLTRKRERLELSRDESDAEEDQDDEEAREERTQICRAIDWKRRHFFVACMVVALFLMVKLEFSYSELFGKNILAFLVLFTVLDLILEQLLTRLLMSEALLVSPILGAIVTTEFIMTMGADDFQHFIVAYFTQTAIVVASRSYLGPWLEKLEAVAQRLMVSKSLQHPQLAQMAKSHLVRQLNWQVQLLNLHEYQAAAQEEGPDDGDEDGGEQPEEGTKQDVLERSEGLEALLASVATYAAQTSALFLVPVALVFISLFANETKIPQGYRIRQADLTYYLLFCVIVVLPQLIADVFLLHVLETVHGYKIYDYFTYCDYRFRIRAKQWVGDAALDRSIAHSWRSIDNMSFSSQYYYIVNLTTWGILFLYLGFTAMIRNAYNPYGDPALIPYVCGIGALVFPLRALLGLLAGYVKLWELTGDENLSRVDASAVNRLDRTNNVRKLVRSIRTNPFRHKFMRVNREWLIHNIALILHGEDYQAHAGAEREYLQTIYQRAVNAEAIDVRLRMEQAKIAEDLAQMPYNARAQAQRAGGEANAAQVVVSDDSVSDIPAPNWTIPAGLTRDHVQKLARMWLAFARQTMRLKAMVSDLVAKQLAAQCLRCKSVYRLQVIQKVGFQQVCDKFRSEHQGIPFSVERWRRFYVRRQVFITLCMECAYIDNLTAAHIIEQDGDLQRLMAENALKNIGEHDKFVARQLKQQHIKDIIRKWLQMGRQSLQQQRAQETLERKLQKKAEKRRKAAEREAEAQRDRDLIAHGHVPGRSRPELGSLANNSPGQPTTGPAVQTSKGEGHHSTEPSPDGSPSAKKALDEGSDDHEF